MNAVHANSPYMQPLGIARKKIEQLPIDVRSGSGTMSATTTDLHFSNGWNSIEVTFRGDRPDQCFPLISEHPIAAFYGGIIYIRSPVSQHVAGTAMSRSTTAKPAS